MPAKVKVKVVAGRDLPVMDKSSDTTDAYVELKLGGVTHKTDICRKSLNPHWACTEWYRFEVDDADLQDEPLQLRLMDHDTYSANDAIGKVYISLNPLLLPLTPHPEGTHSGKGAIMSGWIPVFDTMHGIRGEVNVIVKVELFSDFNKFRQSSCGVQFFHSPIIPHGYQVQAIHGFVEELVVNDDPEYQWIDKIRTPRASNEARQVAFLKLSGQVQRKIGLKALELGANAVIGFKRCLDLEGEVGVVARGAGTAVTLSRIQEPCSTATINTLLSTQVANSPDTLQHQLKKYLEFINTEKSVSDASSVIDTNVLKLLSEQIHRSEISLDQLSIKQENSAPFSNISEELSYQEDINPLKELLRQEDLRKDISQKSLKKRFKKLKNSSQNLFNKKNRSKRFDFSNDDEMTDKSSLNSYSSDRSTKFSFTDIKNEIKRKSNFKSFLSKKPVSDSDGSGMAALLVRSVMHAHSSLDCIKESYESSSPSSTLRRSSKSQPRIEVTSLKVVSPEISIDDTPNCNTNQVDCTDNPLKLQFLSLDNISLNSEKKEGNVNSGAKKRVIESCPTTPNDSSIVKPYLSVPSKQNIGSSMSSTICSSDEYSSSEGDDSDEISENNKNITDDIPDTVSLVVRSVIGHQIDNSVISHMDEKLKSISPKSNEKPPFEFENDLWSSETNSEYNDFKQYISDSKEILLNQSNEFSKIKNNEIGKYTQDANFHINQNTYSEPTISNKINDSQSSSSFHIKSIDSNQKLSPEIRNCISSPPSAAISSPSSADPDKHKFKFHFPKHFFRRHQSEIDENSIKKKVFQKASKISLPSLRPLRRKIRTFSDGNKKNDHPTLVKTAIQTILMEKVNIMGEIINHGPIVGDNEHLHASENEEYHRRQSHNFHPDEDVYDVHSDVLSCYSDDSKHNTLDVPYNTFSHDHLSYGMKDTVLGSRFLSYNELRCYSSHPNINLIDDSKPNMVDNLQSDYTETQMHDSNSEIVPIANNKGIKSPRKYLMGPTLLDRRKSMDPKMYQTDYGKASFEKFVKNEKCTTLVIENTDSKNQNIDFEDLESFLITNNLIENLKTEEINSENQNNSNNSDSESFLITKNLIENLKIETQCDPSKSSEEFSKETFKFKLDSDSGQPKTVHERSGCSKYDGGSLTTGVCGAAVLRPSMNQDNLDLLEYPFLTIVKFPPGFILHLGGAVAARSVKLLERVPNPEEPAPRDAWWSELRTEVRSHMRALRCNAVLAYQETTTICDDVCVLSATGTAAVIDLRLSSVPLHNNLYPTSANSEHQKDQKEHESGNRGELTQTSSLDRTDFDKIEHSTTTTSQINTKCTTEPHGNRKRTSERCGPCHLPYSSGSVPFSVSVTKCAVCKKGRVPSVILCSIEPIEGLSLVGRGCLVQAVASRARVPQRGEPAARDISDQLPFLEYELHRLLLAKLRVRGMNAIFGLKTTIAVGATVVAAVGVGTGVLLAALGTGAGGPKVRAAGDPRLLRALQRGLDDALNTNRNVYHLNSESDSNIKGQTISDTEESEEELPDMEINVGNKDACVFEVDDAEDLEVLKMLTEARPPAGLHVVNTQTVPGLPSCETLGSVAHLQMFTQLWRARLASPTASLHQHFHRLLQSVYFKLRRMVPCAVCDIRFRLDLPEADEIQLVVTGMALGICEPVILSDNKTQNSSESTNKKTEKECDECPVKKSESTEMIFTLDEEASVDVNEKKGSSNKQNMIKQESPGHGITSTCLQNQISNEWRPNVVMTPLASIPGAKILHYLGNLDFIFVRESTSVREQGGLSGFLHTFISEVLAVVRAHVTALSGNAIVAFYMTELILSDNPHKNQAQCLVSVGGDVVFVSYFPNESLS